MEEGYCIIRQVCPRCYVGLAPNAVLRTQCSSSPSLKLGPPALIPLMEPDRPLTTACSCHPRGRPAGGQGLGWLESKKASQKKGHLLSEAETWGVRKG